MAQVEQLMIGTVPVRYSVVKADHTGEYPFDTKAEAEEAARTKLAATVGDAYFIVPAFPVVTPQRRGRKPGTKNVDKSAENTENGATDKAAPVTETKQTPAPAVTGHRAGGKA